MDKPITIWDGCGAVSEWLKEHDWKSCIGQPIEGSNPSRSAIFLFSRFDVSRLGLPQLLCS